MLVLQMGNFPFLFPEGDGGEKCIGKPLQRQRNSWAALVDFLATLPPRPIQEHRTIKSLEL